MLSNKKNLTKKKQLILIADRGRADVAVRLSFLGKKISSKEKNSSILVIYENKKKEIIDIFKLFKIYDSLSLRIKIKKIHILLISIYYTIFSLIKIAILGFDWFVKSYSLRDVRLGDLIYDKYIRKNFSFLNPRFLNIRFLTLLFSSVYKFLILEDVFKKNIIKYSLIGSTTYISVSSILLRISQKKRVPVIYVSGESFKIIKNNQDQGDIISKYLIDKIKSQNKKDILKKSENYFKKRTKGKLITKKYNPKFFFQHDEQTWKNNREESFVFFNKINKFKKKYSHTILYAPHNFAESNHRCGDLIFRDFYQQTIETLKFAKKNKNILWLFKIHPYSEIKYGELEIAKKLFNQFKSENILLVPFKTSNEKLFKSVDLVVSTRGSICLEAATFGVRNLINSDIYYDTFNISKRVKNKKQYFNALLNIRSIKKIDKSTIVWAKKILYFRKILQIENPFNLTRRRKIIDRKTFYIELKKNLKKIYTNINTNTKNKTYDEIVNNL